MTEHPAFAFAVFAILAVLFTVAVLRARTLMISAFQDPERLRSLLRRLLASDVLNAEQKQTLAAYLERRQEQGPAGGLIQPLPNEIASILGLPQGAAAHPVESPERTLPTRPPALFERSGSGPRLLLAISAGAAVAAAVGYWAQ